MVAARKQFLLRIDPELWGDVEKWAADELRSVNAQIEWALREAIRRRKGDRRPDAVRAGGSGSGSSGGSREAGGGPGAGDGPEAGDSPKAGDNPRASA